MHQALQKLIVAHMQSILNHIILSYKAYRQALHQIPLHQTENQVPGPLVLQLLKLLLHAHLTHLLLKTIIYIWLRRMYY